MKVSKLSALIACLFIASCGDNFESTTVDNDSSTSFVESETDIFSTIDETSTIISSNEDSSDSSSLAVENDFIDFNQKVDLNKTNQTNGLAPSTGNVDIILIPIEFEDVAFAMDTTLIDKAFNSKNDENVEWFSVSEYYNISSYGNLNLSFSLLEPFTPSHPSSYYTTHYNNESYIHASGDIIVEALTYYDKIIDYSKYDSNNDGYIDGIYLVYDHPVDYTYQQNLWWAYTYYFVNDKLLFDNLKLKSYVFSGYDFLKQNNQNCNTHTLIHETAHLFGIDDYYDYYPKAGASKGGLAGADIMDSTVGDHNAFTKAMLGWNKGKILTTTKQNLTIELEAFDRNGDYLILANDFDMEKGLLQEYFIVEYYTPTSLNEMDKMYSINGIRVLHIIADAKKDGTLKYDNSVTSAKLISQITTSSGGTYLTSSTDRTDDTLFIEGESLNSVKFSNDERLKYNFSVDLLTNDKATLTFSLR